MPNAFLVLRGICIGGFLMLSAFSAFAVEPRVIIDTDLGSSMDDLFALDFAARMHRAGKLDLKAVMMDRPDGCDPAGEGRFLDFADRYLNTLGFGKDFPLGKSEPLSDGVTPPVVINPYWTLVSSNEITTAWFKSSGRDLTEVPDAVSLYRRLLDDAPEKSVVICAIGFFNNLKALMESGMNHKGDGIASTGQDLIAAKVKELRIMGGCFDGSVARERGVPGEYNVMGDIPSATKIFAEWPTPIVVTPWEVGTKLEYKPEDVLKDFPVGTQSPTIRAVYARWPNPPAGFMNRLWDPMTLFPLTAGETFAPLSEKGGIEVNDEGVTAFTPNASSNRCYQVASNMAADTVMNRLGEIYREGNPSKADPVGVCSWSWHEPMTNILARMEANGFKGIQLALSPWVWEGEGSAAQKETFGDQEGEEVFGLISNKFAKGELDIHATMICFSNEDYTTEHTISNTCGFYYGLAPSATTGQKALADLTWQIRSNQLVLSQGWGWRTSGGFAATHQSTLTAELLRSWNTAPPHSPEGRIGNP